MNYSKRFVVEPGARVKLNRIDPGYIDPDVTEKARWRISKSCAKGSANFRRRCTARDNARC